MTHSLSLAALAIVCTVAAPMALAADLTVTVDGIAAHKGAIVLGLFDADTYEGDGAVEAAKLVIDGPTVSVTFEGLAPGEYAVRLYQDLNNDGTFNTSRFGIPTEPYAFSNNAKGTFGPAKWTAAKFTLQDAPTTHTITLN
ncbi:MAG: DUF2141 domain-containing protein [Pseudomonadota bacterium]